MLQAYKGTLHSCKGTLQAYNGTLQVYKGTLQVYKAILQAYNGILQVYKAIPQPYKAIPQAFSHTPLHINTGNRFNFLKMPACLTIHQPACHAAAPDLHSETPLLTATGLLIVKILRPLLFQV